MSNQNTTAPGGISLVGALGLLFVGLKLGHVIAWPWWLVTLPLWGGAALVAAALAVAVPILIVKTSRSVKAERRGGAA